MQVAAVSEIFLTVQGEGIFAGEKQIFLRFAGCPWRCDYCDTPGSLTASGHQQMTEREILDKIESLRDEETQTVSLTGGEPLSQVDFLEKFLPSLRRRGFDVYLETSGTTPGALSRIVDQCHRVALDIKLPSSIGRSFWEEHSECLKIAGPKAFVKIVLTQKNRLEEYQEAATLVSRFDPVPPVVLQPASPFNGVIQPNMTEILAVRRVFEKIMPSHSDLRIIPQLHRIWGVP